ncbi:MAG: DUF4055 domain-containing protein [bacterium]|nr:DUF4055 domain-containing protein [bacterium]
MSQGGFDITEKAAAYEQRIEQWNKIRDTLEGEDQIKSKGQCYLPRPSAQDDKDYRAYKARASFYGVTERTLRSLVGLVFRIEPEVELVPGLENMILAATPEGENLDSVMREAVRETMSLGRYGVLVDMPQAGAQRAEPYLATFTAENIWRWEEAFDPSTSERVLTRVVLHSDPLVQDDIETDILHELLLVEPEDIGGSNDDTAVSLAGIYVIQIWEKQQSETASESNQNRREETDEDDSGYVRVGAPIVPLIQGAPLNRIPFIFINSTDEKPETSKPPMLDLVNMNIGHYRNSADLEHSLHLTAEPTPWTAANWEGGSEPTSIGSATIWNMPEGGQAGMLEFSGKGIEAISTAMTDKENRMAALGARLIRDQERANVTSETTRLQSKAEESTLTSSVRTVESAFRKALTIATEWVGGNPEANTLDLNKDFVETRMDPQELTALVGAWQAAAMSYDTLWTNMQRGEVADPKRSAEDERELIEEEAPDTPPSITDPANQAGVPVPTGEPQLEAGGSIEARGATGPADGHAHAFELTIADDGTITGTASAQTPDGQALDHEHAIQRLDRTETAGGHQHALPLSGGSGGEETPPAEGA